MNFFISKGLDRVCQIKLGYQLFNTNSLNWWQCGVDANATDRILLQSSKPSIHTNVNCNALAAAIICRQVAVVRLLLQVKILVEDHPNHLGKIFILQRNCHMIMM